jgi:glycosyltransferase involved in cell wall biosynthesis
VLDREGPDLDPDRLVVLPFLPQAHVRDLFRRSDVHIYLTVPFVISWSVLEVMATGCALVAADTQPVREVVEDGRNGVLADMRDPAAIAAAVERLLDDRAEARRLRTAARATILERFALERQLIRQRRLLEQVVNCGR